jgi:RimJ/RimL family protein N-acetyltransferase
MGGGTAKTVDWLVKGSQVGLVTPTRESFVHRWDLYNDPRLGMLTAFQTAGVAVIAKPPVTREHREAVWEDVASRGLMAFDINLVADGRFLGEAGLSKIAWPQASADIAVALFEEEDRGLGYGTEAVMLLVAYAFDALGLNRAMIRYLNVNEAVVHAVEHSAAAVGGRLAGVERDADWAFGSYRDRLVIEVTREDFPPHPATAHLRELPG